MAALRQRGSEGNHGNGDLQTDGNPTEWTSLTLGETTGSVSTTAHPEGLRFDKPDGKDHALRSTLRSALRTPSSPKLNKRVTFNVESRSSFGGLFQMRRRQRVACVLFLFAVVVFMLIIRVLARYTRRTTS